MKTDIKITDEMVERACWAYSTYSPTRTSAYGISKMRRALEAALNPPPLVCKNCGKGKSCHIFVTSTLGEEYRACFGYAWEPAS